MVKDVNSDNLDTWRYRQRYTLAHASLDPVYYYKADVYDGDRLKIIHLLGKSGADFNLAKHSTISIGGTDIYVPHPLHCGRLREDYLGHSWVHKCAPIAIMYGADPCPADLDVGAHTEFWILSI